MKKQTKNESKKKVPTIKEVSRDMAISLLEKAVVGNKEQVTNQINVVHEMGVYLCSSMIFNLAMDRSEHDLSKARKNFLVHLDDIKENIMNTLDEIAKEYEAGEMAYHKPNEAENK